MTMGGATNARLSEVWLDTGSTGAGSPILRRVSLRFKPALMARAISERLARRLELDEADKPTQIEIDATALHTATNARRNRAVQAGDRITISRRMAGMRPSDVRYEHYEIVSIDDYADSRPGGIQRITLGLKAAIPPAGSIASGVSS